jgi:hypothetical protein
LCIVFFANLIIFIPFFLDEKILVKVFIWLLFFYMECGM